MVEEVENAQEAPDVSGMLNPKESIKASAKGKRSSPLIGVISILIFGLIWLFFSGFFTYALMHPDEKADGKSRIIPFAIAIFFDIAGIAMVFYAIFLYFIPGPWFFITNKRLLIVGKKYNTSYDWSKFNGDISVKGDNNKGTIDLMQDTGHYDEYTNSRTGVVRREYVRDKVSIYAIANAQNIANKIKEIIDSKGAK